MASRFWVSAVLLLLSLFAPNSITAAKSSSPRRNRLSPRPSPLPPRIPSPPRKSSPPRPFPPPPPPSPLSAVASPQPQYYMSFGRCVGSLQKQQYGNWVMTRSWSTQVRGRLTLLLDTRNMTHVANASGVASPVDFPMEHLYLAYWNTSAVRAFAPWLEDTPYKETTSNYIVSVNGQPLVTVRDLKNQGPRTETSTTYSLKASLGNTTTPSTMPYTIVISKNCAIAADCGAVPDPAVVFTSPWGHVVWSVWAVSQPMTVNGVYMQNHAWCPVQSALNMR